MNTEELLHGILVGEPSTEFLNASQNISAEQLASLVKALRAQVVLPARLKTASDYYRESKIFDVCGTGGSQNHRLNTSTLVAAFVPDLGVAVVKHGGRSSSGKKGSLDLLEHLGLDVKNLYENSGEALRAFGLSYLGAAYTYSAFGRHAPIRRTFGKPTIFNLLGPLLNPIKPSHRLLGTYSIAVAELMADTLVLLGENGCVVYSEDSEGPLDEASPFGTTTAFLVLTEGEGRGKIIKKTFPPYHGLIKKRTEIFSDGLTPALDMLSNEETLGAETAKCLVAYNLAFVAFMASETDPDTLHDFIHKTYFQILETFPQRALRAKKRFLALSSLRESHDASPTKKDVNFSRSQRDHILKREVFSNKSSHETPLRGMLIAEIKCRTPLREFSEKLSLKERVQAYTHADAISVVTHPTFGGSLDLLSTVKSFTTKPVLAKDFIRTAEHLDAVIRAGADAVLLLEDMLEETVLLDLCERCERAGVTPVVESSWDTPALGIPMLNSRNLFSLEEGRNYRDLISRVEPSKKSLLASGLSTSLDIRMALSESLGVIVGTALMKCESSEEIEIFLKKSKSPRFVFKACGARKSQDVASGVAHRADLIGINLIPSSKRYITESVLEASLKTLQEHEEHVVFLTSSETPPRMLALASQVFAFEQPYGCPLLPRSRGLITPISSPKYLGTRMKILETGSPGSGVSMPYPNNTKNDSTPVLVAGGIHKDNLLDKISEAQNLGWNVIGFDVASAIEETDQNDVKIFSSEKILEFVDLVDASFSKKRM